MAKTDKNAPSKVKDTPKSPSTKSPSSPRKKASPKKSTKPRPEHHTVSNSLELLLPSTLGNPSGECSVLVQIDPEDSAALDFEGTTGAFGRFQVNSEGIILDLKGSQYQGTLRAGPTAMIASLYYAADHTQELRLESITDEFCPLIKTQDLMAKLDGQAEGIDESYKIQEEDINISEKRKEQQQEQEKKQQQKGKGKMTTTNSKGGNTKAKRKVSTGASKSSNGAKKTKVSMGRKKTSS